jgi:hypothetical protein
LCLVLNKPEAGKQKTHPIYSDGFDIYFLFTHNIIRSSEKMQMQMMMMCENDVHFSYFYGAKVD